MDPTRRLGLGLATASALLIGGCVEVDDGPDLGTIAAASTVAEHETTTCSTAVVIELSRQIAAEVDCLSPGQLVPFAEGGDLVFAGSAVLPYVSAAARADLLAAVAAGGGLDLEVTSAYRTVVQQYLLYAWYQRGRCGITAAAVPGNSNHESGRAIDVSNYGAWLGILPDHAWDQTVPGDPVHFDHRMSPDIRGTDVLAFQRLWNRNNPADLIDEDGAWGPQTEARVAAAPAEGFPVGPMCAPGGLDVAIDRLDGPRVLAPGARATVSLTLRNSGTAPWPAGTAVVTAEPAGRASAFGDAAWPAPDRPAVIAAEVAPGGVAEVAFEVIAPDATTRTEVTESFALAAGDTRFGMLALVVTVDPGAGEVSGGCAAGGADGLAPALALGALVLVRRRRRG